MPLSNLWYSSKSSSLNNDKSLLATLGRAESQQSQASLSKAFFFGFIGRKEVGKSTIKKAICGKSSLSEELYNKLLQEGHCIEFPYPENDFLRRTPKGVEFDHEEADLFISQNLKGIRHVFLIINDFFSNEDCSFTVDAIKNGVKLSIVRTRVDRTIRAEFAEDDNDPSENDVIVLMKHEKENMITRINKQFGCNESEAISDKDIFFVTSKIVQALAEDKSKLINFTRATPIIGEELRLVNYVVDMLKKSIDEQKRKVVLIGRTETGKKKLCKKFVQKYGNAVSKELKSVLFNKISYSYTDGDNKVNKHNGKFNPLFLKQELKNQGQLAWIFLVIHGCPEPEDIETVKVANDLNVGCSFLRTKFEDVLESDLRHGTEPGLNLIEIISNEKQSYLEKFKSDSEATKILEETEMYFLTSEGINKEFSTSENTHSSNQTDDESYRLRQFFDTKIFLLYEEAKEAIACEENGQSNVKESNYSFTQSQNINHNPDGSDLTTDQANTPSHDVENFLCHHSEPDDPSPHCF